LACAASTAPYWQSADALLGEVKRNGPSNVIEELWAKPSWDYVMHKIASGESAWLKVAAALRSGSDAGSTSELKSAMYRALKQNPSGVLRALDVSTQNVGKVFYVSEICTRQVDFPSDDEALAELKQTRLVVERVQDLKIRITRDRCLAALRDSEKSLKNDRLQLHEDSAQGPTK
jgi:hypothetical protein